MPFCSNCGAKVEAGNRFCIGCGSPVEQTAVVPAPVYVPVSAIAQQGNLRQQSIIEINRMIQYFSKKQAQYDEYDDCCEKISYYSNPRSRVSVRGGRGTIFKVFGLIMTIGGGIYCLFSLMVMAVYSKASRADPEAVAFMVIPWVVLAAGIAFLIVSGIKSRAYAGRVKAERERLLRYYEERCDALASELSTYFFNYGYCPVAASYTNPRILQLIRDPINLGRADTIKEAINVMIMDTHNSEMELQAKLAAQSAASAARGAKAAAFFSAAHFIRHF